MLFSGSRGKRLLKFRIVVRKRPLNAYTSERLVTLTALRMFASHPPLRNFLKIFGPISFKKTRSYR